MRLNMTWILCQRDLSFCILIDSVISLRSCKRGELVTCFSVSKYSAEDSYNSVLYLLPWATVNAQHETTYMISSDRNTSIEHSKRRILYWRIKIRKYGDFLVVVCLTIDVLLNNPPFLATKYREKKMADTFLDTRSQDSSSIKDCSF